MTEIAALREATAESIDSGKRLAMVHYGTIAGVVLLTRGMLFGNYLGEADSARYTFGLRFWLESGPGGLSIINRELSSGYYWFAALLVRTLDISYSHFPVLLNSFSLMASIGAALVLYRLGSMVVSRNASLASTLALAVSPSFWWAGIEPHPQAVGFCFALLSMLFFVEAWLHESRRWFLLPLSSIVLGLSFLTKSDFFLLVLTYPVLCLFVERRDTAQVERSFWVRSVALSGVIAGGGYILGWLGKLAILRQVSTSHSAWAHVRHYLEFPHGIDLLLQSVPVLFGPGLFTFLMVIGCALAFFAKRQNPRGRWLLLIASWSLPGYVFWFLIVGNNVRHLIALTIPIFWLAYSWLECRGKRAFLLGVILPLAAGLLIPPNSNLTAYPSPNVPGSWAEHHSLEARLYPVVDRLLFEGTGKTCFLGASTQDFVVQHLLERADALHYRAAVEMVPWFRANLYRPDGSFVRQVDVIGPVDDARALDLRDCTVLESVEYTSQIRTHRYFGDEWVSLIRLVLSGRNVPSGARR